MIHYCASTSKSHTFSRACVCMLYNLIQFRAHVCTTFACVTTSTCSLHMYTHVHDMISHSPMLSYTAQNHKTMEDEEKKWGPVIWESNLWGRGVQITLGGESLSTELSVTNKDSKPFEFTTALHSYFSVTPPTYPPPPISVPFGLLMHDPLLYSTPMHTRTQRKEQYMDRYIYIFNSYMEVRQWKVI